VEYDILIRGGLLFDGSGSPGVPGDVAVRNGIIAAIGSDLPGTAATVIDAAGLAVCPGFIDIKTHSDFTLPLNPKAESKIRQGVTTEIIGHCGFSVAPVLPGKVKLLQDYLSPSAFWLKFQETSFPNYLDTFPATSVNVGMLVGHNTLRLMVMGMEDRPPTAEELAAMGALLEDGLAAGAVGFSSGLFTAPGAYADRTEMLALCRIAARHKAGYFTHLRDESAYVLEAVDEAIEIAEQCGIHVEIVHFKCSGIDAWGKVGQALDRMDAARARGCDVDCDAYPYVTGTNPLKNLMPTWVQEGGVAAMIERLRQPQARTHMRDDILANGLNNWGRVATWDAVQILISPRLPEFVGQTIGELAAARGADPIDVVCDYLIADEGATRVLVHSMHEDDVRALIRAPAVLVGSDGNCVADYGITSTGMAHPRFYGTFPRVLGRYVGQLGLLPLELAIHKMTGATARALKLHDRGLLREGWRADITLFDPNDFLDQATFAQPHRYPTGPRTSVLVNGVLVLHETVHTGALPGVVLRRDATGQVH
jgi:N-acyl-D-amino-acid deacylase